MSVTLKPDAGSSAAYYQFYKKSELPLDEALLVDLLTYGYMLTSEFTVSAYSLNADTEYVLAAVAIDVDGKYGEICKFECKTLGVTFSDTFTLTVSPQEIEAPFNAATQGKFKFVVEGGSATQFYYLNLTDSEAAVWESDEAIATELVLNTTYNRKSFFQHHLMRMVVILSLI